MLDLSSLEKAIQSLESGLVRVHDAALMAQLDEESRRLMQAGVIQNFEFTYELCWKFIKRWLEINLGSVYVDGVSRKELFRIAAEYQLITDVKIWWGYHEARNQSSHVYNQDVAAEVFASAEAFFDDAKALLKVISERND
ncbi:MAG: nucleotidyltransferase substrate binding protein [Desulfuromonadales bacterium]|nr:nucleotidyltransferase substrate binding protein [Desulfuromonadales bacterium]